MHGVCPGICKLGKSVQENDGILFCRANGKSVESQAVEIDDCLLYHQKCPSRSLPRHGINRKLVAGQDREL